MAWNLRTSKQGVKPDLEIFAVPTNDQGFASIVVDAQSVAPDVNGDRILKAGTILSKNATTKQYERFTAGSGQAVKGILARTLSFPDGTSKSDLPGELAFHSEVFRADRILDYTTHAVALKAALPTCLFR